MKTTPWAKTIREACYRGGFTPLDRASAGGWGYCRVGEFRDRGYRIPVYQKEFRIEIGNFRYFATKGAPKNLTLFKLGCSFSNAIHNNDIGEARSIARKIKAEAIRCGMKPRRWRLPKFLKKARKGQTNNGNMGMRKVRQLVGSSAA